VNDQTNDSRPAIIEVNNIAAYKTPKALPAYAATPVNTELVLGLDIVDFYLSDIATINLTTPTNGKASYVNGKVLYTPNEGYIGLDTFSYTVDDDRSKTTNTINVKVFAAYKTNTKPGFMLEGVIHGHPVAQSIAISGDGSIVAASSGNDPSINPFIFEGHVVVYKRDSQTGVYNQLGNQLFGEKALDQFGGVISLSADGKRLAVATNKASGYSDGNIDYLKIYQYNETSEIWEQIGQTFTFEGGGSLVDLKLDLNADGSILAIGNPRTGFTDYVQGTVEVFQFKSNNNQWVLLGDEFKGTLGFGYLGDAISLNAVGNVIAISEPLDEFKSNKPGYVKIYQFNGISWIQKGKSLRGIETIDRFGVSISLNNAGNVISIGADYQLEQPNQPGKAGSVSVYSFNESKNDWELKGQTIDGRLESDYVNLMFGHSVSMDGSGDILSVGAPTFDSEGINNLETFTLVYKYNKQNDLWSRINLTNNSGKIGSSAYPKSGSSVALSSDGTVLWNGFKPKSDKRESAVMAYKLISDFEAEIEDVNFAPEPNDDLIRKAFQRVSEELLLVADDPERVQLTYFISKAPNNGSLKTKDGKEIVTGEFITDFTGGYIFYTSNAVATSDYLEFKAYDGEKYGTGLIWIDPISKRTVPIITLLGNNPETIQVGASYTDAGATAIDKNDGDLTSSIILTGSVDASTVGVYTLSYDVSDAASNVAATVTRTVNVINTLATDVFENSKISIYPNPTKDVLNITGDVSILKSIEVYSILGKRLIEVKENFNEINISNLQSGMYLLRVNTDEASVTYRIVKE
jgi:hypothetical protein